MVARVLITSSNRVILPAIAYLPCMGTAKGKDGYTCVGAALSSATVAELPCSSYFTILLTFAGFARCFTASKGGVFRCSRTRKKGFAAASVNF